MLIFPCGPTTIASHVEANVYLVNPAPLLYYTDPSSYDLHQAGLLQHKLHKCLLNAKRVLSSFALLSLTFSHFSFLGYFFFCLTLSFLLDKTIVSDFIIHRLHWGEKPPSYWPDAHIWTGSTSKCPPGTRSKKNMPTRNILAPLPPARLYAANQITCQRYTIATEPRWSTGKWKKKSDAMRTKDRGSLRCWSGY